MSDIPQQNPFEYQRKQALELYENMVKECHQWSSFIQRAIESYNPDLQAQLSELKARENELILKHTQ